jgi:hypothetical protein
MMAGKAFSGSRNWAILFFFLLAVLPFGVGAQGRNPPPRIDFSGYSWRIKTSMDTTGPQNNYFGGRDLSVTQTNSGSLLLSLAYFEGRWWAGEVYMTKRLGYGTYTFRVASPLASLDPNAVLGLFTYSDQNAYAHREIDIEFSAWAIPGQTAAGQYVVQPYTVAGNLWSFPLEHFTGPSSHSFTWLPDRIEFASWRGYGPRPPVGDAAVEGSWVFTDRKRIPLPG